MGIFTRIADIINSNLNALLDRAENPEKMIRNIIHEMEDTLVEVRSMAAKTIAEKKQLQRRLELLHIQQQTWQDKAELALSKHREDLAAAALIEKEKAADSFIKTEHQIQHHNEDLQKYNDDISHLQEKIVDARERQKN